MSTELFTANGERQYLIEDELDRFLAVTSRHERGEVSPVGSQPATAGDDVQPACGLDTRGGTS